MSDDQLDLDQITHAIAEDLGTLSAPQTFEPGRQHWRAAQAIQGNADALVAEVRRLREAFAESVEERARLEDIIAERT